MLTYKLSQDYLEMFFALIRSWLGRNDNPTSLDLTRILRKILVGKIDLSFTTGSNCQSIDNTIIAAIPTVNDIVSSDPTVNELNSNFDHDYVPEYDSLTKYCENVVTYIGGLIVRKLRKTINCALCLSELFSDGNQGITFELINVKKFGGLITPSNDVVKICTWSEKILRQETGLQPLFQNNLKFKITLKVMQSLPVEELFSNLKVHVLDNSFDGNHISLLIKKKFQNIYK